MTNKTLKNCFYNDNEIRMADKNLIFEMNKV